MYVSCNRSWGLCCISTGFVELVACHLLRQALNQPDSIQEMEIILKSCVGNGSPHGLDPITSSKKSRIWPSKGISSHIHQVSRHLIHQRRRPVHIPNPLHPQLVAGTHCPLPPNPYLGHKSCITAPATDVEAPNRLSRPDASIVSPYV